jgi:Homing endonuclease associated repeat
MGIHRFEDDCLDIIWAGIQVLDPGRADTLVREMATVHALSALSPRSDADKVRAGVYALRDVADILGHSPTISEYRKCRAELPELRLPPDGTLRRWLGGGWNDCLARALLDAVTDGDLALQPVALNQRFEDEEVLGALRACKDELAYLPSLTQYLQWARRPDVRERPGRRPLSYQVFERFGGFPEACVAAGLVPAGGARVAANGRVIPSLYRYQDEDLTNALVTVAAVVEGSPSRRQYRHQRRLMIEAGRQRGENVTLPTAEVIVSRFRTWNKALIAAGLEPLADSGQPHLGERPPRYSEAEKLEWIRRAWVDVGEPFTGGAYSRWRRKEMAVTGLSIPCLPVLERTFGSWSRARELAIPEHPSDNRALDEQ